MSGDEVAKAFVQHYYQTWNSNPDALAGLYVSTPKLGLKSLRLFVKNHSCIAPSRPLPGSQQLPLVLQTTPLASQVPPGSTPIDGGGILLFLDFRHFRPLAPHPRPPRTLYVHSTTDPTPKASLSPFFSI